MTKTITDFTAAMERLRFADSYSRMNCLLNLKGHPSFYAMMGREWSGCDNIADHAGGVASVLSASPWPIAEAMTDEEISALAALPPEVQVYRGAYVVNARGFSWSLDRATAARFPFLWRYRRMDEQAILTTGTIQKQDIAFLKLDRGEFEVVTLPDRVFNISTHPLQADVVAASGASQGSVIGPGG